MTVGTRSRPARSPPRPQPATRTAPRSAVPVVPATANPRAVKTGAPEDTCIGLAVWALVVLGGLYLSYNMLRVHPDRVAVVPPLPRVVPFQWWQLRSFMPF